MGEPAPSEAQDTAVTRLPALPFRATRRRTPRSGPGPDGRHATRILLPALGTSQDPPTREAWRAAGGGKDQPALHWQQQKCPPFALLQALPYLSFAGSEK